MPFLGWCSCIWSSQASLPVKPRASRNSQGLTKDREPFFQPKLEKGIKLRLFSFVACFDILRICASNYIHKMLSIFEVVDKKKVCFSKKQFEKNVAYSSKQQTEKNAIHRNNLRKKCYLIILTTSTVLKSHQAGKVTSSPWHGGDKEKSHQVVESHIREEESPWHSLFHLYLEM